MRSVIDWVQPAGDDRKGAFLRRFAHDRRVHAWLCFFLAFAVVWLLGALPRSPVFWTVLDMRFAADERYQIQRLFLPDQARRTPTVIVGDAMFQASVHAPKTLPSDARSVVINGYDANDLRTLFRGLSDGMRYTDTEMCSLVVQVSPFFMVRSKAMYESQDVKLIREADVPKAPWKRFRDLSRILTAWAETENTMPAMAGPARRPHTMVGQTQFADPTRENWNLAFAGAEGFEGSILLVLDTRGTKWPAASDLIDQTRRGLEDLTAANQRISWTTIDDLDPAGFSGCAP